MKLNKHTVYDKDKGRCEPAHQWGTCEICNIYWQKAFDNQATSEWLEHYHNQAQEWLKKQDNLFIEIDDNG